MMIEVSSYGRSSWMRCLLIFFLVLLMLMSVLPGEAWVSVEDKEVDVFAPPFHIMYGYGFYSDGDPAAYAEVDVLNTDNGEYIYTSTDSYGFYSFNTGTFNGPGWENQSVLLVSIVQNGTEDHMMWSGNVSVVINNDLPSQEIPNVTLLPPPAPDVPGVPVGPSSGVVGVSYSYSSSTTDPLGIDVKYGWDWDDGSPVEWTDWYASGEVVSVSHVWNVSGVYSIRVRALNKGGQMSDWSDPLVVTISPLNSPPFVPSDPSPGNNSVDVNVNVVLSWVGGDPDPGDIVTYDVYFGTTTDPPKVSNNQTTTNYNPGTLNYNTKYYWKITAWDNHGAHTNGPLWSFTTTSQSNNPPNTPSNPSPVNHATDVDVDTMLSWDGGDPDPGDIVTYDVYFGTTTDPPKVSNNQTTTNYNPGTLNYNTKYYWKITAWDNHGAHTNGPLWSFTTSSEPNTPPDIPSVPSGPTGLKVDEVGVFSTSSVDPDGDRVRYRFDWDADGGHDYSGWSGLYDSGDVVMMNHSWGSPGTYVVKAQARDEHGGVSGWSYGLTVTVMEEENHPPGDPGVTGPGVGKTGERYTYEMVSFDPDGDRVKYYIEWGDGDTTITGFYDSGEIVRSSHIWDVKGEYSVRVKAVDEHGAESGYTTLKVSIPRWINVFARIYELVMNILERFGFIKIFLYSIK